MQDNTKTLTYSRFAIEAVLETNQEIEDIKSGVETCISKELDVDKSNVDLIEFNWYGEDSTSTMFVTISDVNIDEDDTATDLEKSLYVAVVDNWDGIKNGTEVKAIDYTVL